jgi:TolB-like protein
MEAALRQAVNALPGQRTRSLGQWWALATMMAAIVVLVATLIGTVRPGAPSSTISSIAVLPLRFVSGEADAPYLADGLTDQLISTLGQIHTLKVTAQTSVARFKGTDVPVAEIARQLGVDGVVEGTVLVQRGTGTQPTRARVNVRLIKAGTDLDLWSGSLERPLGDMLALESELARTIARQMRGALAPAESGHLGVPQKTDPAAEQAYFEGRAHLSQRATRAGLALTAFQRALAIDPMHAGAHAGAARSFVALGFARAIPQSQARASALTEVTRALQIDDESAEAHGVLGDIKFFYDWDWAAAEREYRRAIELGPSASDIRGQYAQFLAAVSRLQEAESEATESTVLNPLSADAALTRALIVYYERRYDDSLTITQHAVQLDPNLATSQFLLGRIYEAQNRLTDAAQVTNRAIRMATTVPLGWQVQALRLEALSGRQSEAQVGFDRLLADPAQDNHLIGPQTAYLRLALGQPEEALNALRRAVSERDPGVLWLAVDPRLDPLRGRPEFSALLTAIGLQ